MTNILEVKEREIELMREENTELYRKNTILENMLYKIPSEVVEKYC